MALLPIRGMRAGISAIDSATGARSTKTCGKVLPRIWQGFIAVYPSAGWWRTRSALERYALPARYSLIVSLRTDQVDVDLYDVIANKIAVVT